MTTEFSKDDDGARNQQRKLFDYLLSYTLNQADPVRAFESMEAKRAFFDFLNEGATAYAQDTRPDLPATKHELYEGLLLLSSMLIQDCMALSKKVTALEDQVFPNPSGCSSGAPTNQGSQSVDSSG